MISGAEVLVVHKEKRIKDLIWLMKSSPNLNIRLKAGSILLRYMLGT